MPLTELQADKYVARAMTLVNGFESFVERSWGEFDTELDAATTEANMQMHRLINSLDTSKRDPGFIDFSTVKGRQRKLTFLNKLNAVYSKWRNRLGKFVGSVEGADPWKISLGLIKYKPSLYLLRSRDEVIRYAFWMGSILDDFYSVGALSEARSTKKKAKNRTKRVKTAGIISARLTGRGLRKKRGAHSRGTSIILGGLKGIITDQEKAKLENTLRGLDQLPRSHANKMFDAVTGKTLKQKLNEIADEFSTGKMNKRQLKLSMETHFRAMLRRIATQAEDEGDLFRYLQVPPTRKKDKKKKPSKSTKDRALRTTSFKELMGDTKNSGDSLGKFPGDKVIPIPFPKDSESTVVKSAERARRRLVPKEYKPKKGVKPRAKIVKGKGRLVSKAEVARRKVKK